MIVRQIIEQYYYHLESYERSLLGENGGSAPLRPQGEYEFVDITYVVRKLEELVKKTKRPEVILEYGLSLDVSSHGLLGYAARTAPTVRDAIHILTELFHSRITAFDIRLCQLCETYAAIRFLPSDSCHDDNANVFEALAGVWARAAKDAVRLPAPYLRFEVPYTARFDQQKYCDLTGYTWEFNRPFYQIVLHQSVLDLPMDNDPVLSELAKFECEKLVSDMPSRKVYATKIAEVVRENLQEPYSFEQIADMFHMTPRSLRRKLKDESTNFTDIYKDVRLEAAITALTYTDVSIETIASNLGFTSTAVFNASFKKWMGMTPSAYRKSNPAASSS